MQRRPAANAHGFSRDAGCVAFDVVADSSRDATGAAHGVCYSSALNETAVKRVERSAEWSYAGKRHNELSNVLLCSGSGCSGFYFLTWRLFMTSVILVCGEKLVSTKDIGAFITKAMKGLRRALDGLWDETEKTSRLATVMKDKKKKKKEQKKKKQQQLQEQEQEQEPVKVKHPKCPMCGVRYASLSRHLRETHGVEDVRLRRLLVSRRNLRYSGKLRCPVKGCNSDREYVRLDKHLVAQHKFSTVVVVVVGAAAGPCPPDLGPVGVDAAAGPWPCHVPVPGLGPVVVGAAAGPWPCHVPVPGLGPVGVVVVVVDAAPAGAAGLWPVDRPVPGLGSVVVVVVVVRGAPSRELSSRRAAPRRWSTSLIRPSSFSWTASSPSANQSSARPAGGGALAPGAAGVGVGWEGGRLERALIFSMMAAFFASSIKGVNALPCGMRKRERKNK
ncbi:proteoglycan 4-like [Scomber scombrus]|uniref:Proteoglycan 4-like n=1 Tax=Scomber scombrus TaxID=13677 RepID=A0AAV1Q3L5_SCOSC